jgi:hypothetical protein
VVLGGNADKTTLGVYVIPKQKYVSLKIHRTALRLPGTQLRRSSPKDDLKLVPNLTHVRSSLTPQQELLLDHCVQKLLVDRLPDYIIGSRPHQRVRVFIAEISRAPHH